MGLQLILTKPRKEGKGSSFEKDAILELKHFMNFQSFIMDSVYHIVNTESLTEKSSLSKIR